MSMILTFARTWAGGIASCGTKRDSASLTPCAMACGWRVVNGSATNRTLITKGTEMLRCSNFLTLLLLLSPAIGFARLRGLV
jgi:hypothetical protein